MADLKTRMEQMKIDGMEMGSSEKSFEGIMAATSILHHKAMEIKAKRPKWGSYLQSTVITPEEFEFISQYDGAGDDQRNDFVNKDKARVGLVFTSLIQKISKDEIVQYLLILVDEMMNDDKGRVEIFRSGKKGGDWTPFLQLLNRNCPFIRNMSARILAKMACWTQHPMEGSDLIFYLTWLKEQLRIHGNEYIQSVARCLQMMMRVEPYREAFMSLEGISTIVYVLGSKINFQIQYQLTFCLWILTFNPQLAESMGKYNVIPILGDILSDSAKEKVTRIVLATMRNLIEKPTEPSISKSNAITMFHCKVLKHLQLMQNSGQKFEDPDVIEDIDFLTETLLASVVDLSSFDEYMTEVKSGRLTWSPVHSSEKFWRENAQRLNEKNYELLKILIRLLESSKDPEVLAISAHDIGEYVRHYARGKQVAENLGGKHLVMQMLTHEDPNVRYEALLCVQKMMVTHWEYLGRQLEKDTKVTRPTASGKA